LSYVITININQYAWYEHKKKTNPHITMESYFHHDFQLVFDAVSLGNA